MGAVNVIHLNTYQNNGGAGRACLRLHNALSKAGVDSNIWVNYSFEKEARAHNFSSRLYAKGITAAGILAEQLIVKAIQKPVPVPFSFPFAGRDISRHKAIQAADIIHLHWINHAFLKPENIAQLASLKKPLVWTFHDSNAFTGGCHVRYECDHFTHQCGNCPVLKNPAGNDWSHRIWKAKNRAYGSLPLHIIAPSNWMARSVKQSRMLGQQNVSVIPNTLNTNLFKPSPKANAKQKIGIAHDQFVMMSGFMPSKKDLHKGTVYLLEALQIITQQNSIPQAKAKLIIFGNRDEANLPPMPVETIFLGTIHNDEELAAYYSAADVFLAPSLEDNLPNTVMESLACGTPVVGFDTGGIPDMVKHKQNGYIAGYRSSADLATGIQWVYDHPDRQQLNKNARNTITEHFSEQVIARQHISLYNSLNVQNI